MPCMQYTVATAGRMRTLGSRGSRRSKMSRTPRILLLLLLTLLLPGLVSADGQAPAKVQRAAEAGLPDFLAALPLDSLADYGFHSADETREASLGHPYRIHTLPPGALTAAISREALSPLLRTTDMWLFPVMVGGEPRVMLLVDLTPDGYRAVQLGNTTLPSLLAAWEARLPTEAMRRDLGACDVRFVRVPQAYSDFLLITSADGEYVAPLHLATELNHLAMDQLHPAGEVLPALSTLIGRQEVLPADSGGPAGGPPVRTDQSARATGIWIVALAALAASLAALVLHRTRTSSGGRP